MPFPWVELQNSQKAKPGVIPGASPGASPVLAWQGMFITMTTMRKSVWKQWGETDSSKSLLTTTTDELRAGALAIYQVPNLEKLDPSRLADALLLSGAEPTAS